MKAVYIILFLLLQTSIFSQNYYIRGEISEKESGLPLSFATVRVAGTGYGTTANKYGKYELKIRPGNYKLVVSFIGYISDSAVVKANKNLSGVNFSLSKTKVDLPEIIVRPGENPAVGIIRKAIERRKIRDKLLNSYEFEAYTKGLIMTQQDLESDRSSVNLSVGDADTLALKITGVLENQSKGYFKKPGNYKEVIIARKQTANFPPSINVLTGGRIIKNLYEEDLNFFGKELPGPLSDNALKYYYYFIQNMAAIDNRKVYEIHIEPDVSSDPGLVGTLYITDSTYDMIKVNLQLNRAANTGGLLDTINVFQQFLPYDGIYMPVDYRLSVKANILGLFKLGFDLNTNLYDYKINPEIRDDFFDKAIITVVPDADKKDSAYWVSTQTIPSTMDEQTAYKRIDSISSVPKTFWDKFSILSTRINWGDNFSTNAPLSIYHFNRVEGHALDLNLYLDHEADERLNSSLALSYGFSDKYLKKDFNTSFRLGNYRTSSLSLNVYDRLNILFDNSDVYNELTTTLLSLISKYEFRDYYYSRGFSFSASSEVTPVLQLKAGFLNRTDKNAFVNTDYSFFAKDRKYKDNLVINENRINALTGGFRLDFRDYIEDGLFRRRVDLNGTYFIIEGGITYSNKNFLKSSLNFTKYELTVSGGFSTYKSAGLDFKIYSQYNRGTLPYQMLYALPGNINLTAEGFTFRTLDVNEIVGENIITLCIQHNWNDELFRLSGIPGLKTSELQLQTYVNAAYSTNGSKTESYSPHPLQSFKSPFFEAGFSIGHVLFPMQIDFGWKLNHKGKNNFRVGIISLLF